MYFSNVQFLKNIKQDTKAKSQLKHLLVLLARILTILALVFAFAQPFIPSKNSSSRHASSVGIYIDNSFSMEAESQHGKLISVAKQKAHQIAEAYPLSTRFLLVTNDFEGKHQHLVNREQLFDFINDIKISPNVRNLSSVFARQQDFLRTNTKDAVNQQSFILSDFQKISSDFSKIMKDTLITTHLIPLQTQKTNNLFIDSCWFESPSRKLNQTEEFFVGITNNSSESYQKIPVKLFLNGKQKALASFNVKPKSTEIVKLSFTNAETGIMHGVVEIADYPVTFDNKFHFSYSIANELKLLIINNKEENKFINALFALDTYIDAKNISEDNIQTSQFQKYHAIILNQPLDIASGLAQELANYVSVGGSLIFFPNFEGNISAYNSLLTNIGANYITRIDSQKTRVSEVNVLNDIYAGVFDKIAADADLPVIFKHFVFSKQTKIDEVSILTALNGNTILSGILSNKGRVFVFAHSPTPDAGTFVQHKLFIPTLFNMVLYSQISRNIYHTIGKSTFIEFTNQHENTAQDIYHISSPDKDFDFIPTVRKKQSNHSVELGISYLQTAGNYNITANNISVGGTAFNYDRAESDLDCFSLKDISKQLEKNRLENFSIMETKAEIIGKNIEEISRGTHLWKLFVVLALFFIAAEVALLRLWK